MLSLSLTFLILLFVSALIFQWRKTSLALAALISLLWLSILTGVLPNLLLVPLQSNLRITSPGWKTTNTIVLLGSGTIQWPDQSLSTQALGLSRVNQAAELYQHCSKKSDSCSIIASGGDPGNWGQSEAELMAEELQRLGVNRIHILTEAQSLNTYDNARYSMKLLEGLNPEKVYLVTSGIHMNRALTQFEYFKRHSQFEIVPAPADYYRAGFRIRGFAYNAHLCDMALHEYAGFAQFYIYRLIGLR